MIISTRVFLILLLLPLVHGVPTGAAPGTVYQSIPPQAAAINPGHGTALPSVVEDLSLQAIDIRFHVIILDTGCKYGPPGYINIPIPADGYYRVPSMVLIETQGSLHRFQMEHQVVRIREAKIDKLRLRQLFMSHSYDDIPVLRLHVTPQFDWVIRPVYLPPGSMWSHGQQGTVRDIPEGEYFDVPQMAVVTSPLVGTFSGATGRVVRILHIDGIQAALERYVKRCNYSYASQSAHLPTQERDHHIYLEYCMHNMWNAVVTQKKVVQFSPVSWPPHVT